TEIGEQDGPNTGHTRILTNNAACLDGGCLTIETTAELTGVERPLDLSQTRSATLELQYHTLEPIAADTAPDPIANTTTTGTEDPATEPEPSIEPGDETTTTGPPTSKPPSTEPPSGDPDDTPPTEPPATTGPPVTTAPPATTEAPDPEPLAPEPEPAEWTVAVSPDSGQTWIELVSLEPAPNGANIEIDISAFATADTMIRIVGQGGTGSVALILSVAVTADTSNTNPRARNDRIDATAGQPITIDVLTNDTDPDGDQLTVTAVATPEHGNASLKIGTLTYVAHPNFAGKDRFEYTITDGYGGTTTGTVVVTVTSAEPTIKRGKVDLSPDKLALPMTFEANKGQTDADVDFIARGRGYQVFLSDGDATIAVGKSDKGYAIRMDLVDANPAPALTEFDKQPGHVNYFIGNDPAAWQSNVATYSAVEYRDVYPGIDLRYYGNDRQLEYDFIVQPGADPATIAVAFDGAASLAVTEAGDLEVGINRGRTVTFSAPVTYQDIDGDRVPVASSYVLEDDVVSFEVGEYDPSVPLIIDPTLDYSTEVGGTLTDRASGIAVDASGNTYITGHTEQSSYPSTVGPYGAGGSFDIMVTKLSADGSTVVWSTIVGGTGVDSADDIRVDAAGNVYVSGDANSGDFPLANAYDSSLSGSYDAVLFKLNPTGTSLLYSTYWGGTGSADT
ncbi:MAG: hypothetical protein GY708_06250, partial [Actinomycetia bacterium]|nr:hypothetical protein [Actinomycetes bacterium]